MALFHRERTGEGQEVEVAICETMASFMLVGHANGAMFDPHWGPRSTRGGSAELQAAPHQRRLHRPTADAPDAEQAAAHVAA
jgi:crotonobetainyl-CoA:carnitine CoA-transferase CaiB-like acyl-CoA transferase